MRDDVFACGGCLANDNEVRVLLRRAEIGLGAFLIETDIEGSGNKVLTEGSPQALERTNHWIPEPGSDPFLFRP